MESPVEKPFQSPLELLTLENPYVRLEPLSHDHCAGLQEAVKPGKLWQTWYTTVPAPQDMAATIDKRLALHAAGTMTPWAVVNPATGQAVGMTTYMNIDEANRRVEIGSTWMGKEAQGTAINPSAKYLMLKRAFADVGCIAVEFRTHWHNRQSRAAIAKLGAKQDGVLRNHQFDPQGNLRDTVVFSIIASEWPTVKFGLEARIAAWN